jgi:Ca-activated chloride channel family protein
LAALGRSLSKREITVTTIGLGLDYDEDLMTALAAESGGSAYFARHSGMLSEIFTRDMEDAVTLTARKVRVTLKCGDGIKAIGTIGRTAQKSSSDGSVVEPIIEVAIDNLYGAEKYALFEIEIVDMEALNSASPLFDAATVKLEYLNPATDSIVVREEPLRLCFAENDDEVEKNRHTDIVVQAEVARNAEIREKAIRLSDEGRADEAARLLQERAGTLRQFISGTSSPQLEADAVEFESIESELQHDALSSKTRKKTLNEAYIQKNQQSTVHEDEDSKLPQK